MCLSISSVYLFYSKLSCVSFFPRLCLLLFIPNLTLDPCLLREDYFAGTLRCTYFLDWCFDPNLSPSAPSQESCPVLDFRLSHIGTPAPSGLVNLLRLFPLPSSTVTFPSPGSTSCDLDPVVWRHFPFHHLRNPKHPAFQRRCPRFRCRHHVSVGDWCSSLLVRTQGYFAINTYDFNLKYITFIVLYHL